MIELTENMLRLQYDSFKKYVNFIEKELEILRAKLEKTEKVVAVAERASTAVNQMICTCAFITRCEKCELEEALQKLGET